MFALESWVGRLGVHSVIPLLEICRIGWAGSPSSLPILGIPRTSKWALNGPLLGPSWIAIENSLCHCLGASVRHKEPRVREAEWLSTN